MWNGNDRPAREDAQPDEQEWNSQVLQAHYFDGTPRRKSPLLTIEVDTRLTSVLPCVEMFQPWKAIHQP